MKQRFSIPLRWVIISLIIISSLVVQSFSNATTEEQPLEQRKQSRALSERIVEYHIDVQLDAQKKQLKGQQTLTWMNPGERPVTEIYLHLYPNAFQSKKTTFIQESGGKLRNDTMPKNSFGHLNILALQTLNGNDLTNQMKFVQPDDGNKHDYTLLQVKLFEPVNPGDELTLKMGFEVQLPFVFAR